MNRKYIGIDIAKEYCEISRERLKQHRNEQLDELEIELMYNPSMKKNNSKIKTIDNYL